MVQLVIRSSLLQDYHRLALSLRLDPIALMRQAGISPSLMRDSETVLPMRSLNRLLELTATQSGVEDFGLQLAQTRGVPDVGPALLMIREEATLEAALRTLIAFIHLHSEALILNLDRREQPVLITDIIVDSPHRKQASETSVASIISLIRWLVGDHWSPQRVFFSHTAPQDMRRHAQMFRCPVEFGRDTNGIVLRDSDLSATLPSSSGAIRQQVERYLSDATARMQRSFTSRAARLIVLGLSTGDSRASDIARALGISVRTLNRQFQSEGTDYSSTLNSIRKDLARQYLLDSERSLSDIATCLGFESLSAFSTWFKRSFECPPTRWRRQVLDH